MFTSTLVALSVVLSLPLISCQNVRNEQFHRWADSTIIEMQQIKNIDSHIPQLKQVDLYLDSAVQADIKETYYIQKWIRTHNKRDWNLYEHYFNKSQYYLRKSINAFP